MSDLVARPGKVFHAGNVRAATWRVPERTDDERIIERPAVILETVKQQVHGDAETSSLIAVNDIPKALLVLRKAYEYLHAIEQTERSHPTGDHWREPERIP